MPRSHHLNRSLNETRQHKIWSLARKKTKNDKKMKVDSQTVGLTADQLLRIPTPDGVRNWLGESKVVSAGVSRYPAGETEKQADRRGSYRRPLQRLDQQVRLVHWLQGSKVFETCCVSLAWGPGRLQQRYPPTGSNLR